MMVTILLIASSVTIADVEPNDTRDTAENIELGQAILGSLDAASDIHDFHNITLNMNNSIVAILDGPSDADFDLRIYDSGGLQVAGDDSDLDADEVLVYTPPSNGSYFIDVFAYLGRGSYSLEVKIPGIAPGTAYELKKAESEGYIVVALNGVYIGPGESFNLTTGENVFFGLCVDIEIASVVTSDLDIIIPEGQLLIADNEAMESKVVTSRHVIHVPALTKTTRRLYAMSTNMKKDVPDARSTFHIGDMAEGDLKKVVEEVNATDNQNAAGQIAVWMVTDSATRGNLKQLAATDTEIEVALDILNNVDVESPFSDGTTTDSSLLYCAGLIMLVIVLIIVIAFLSQRSKSISQGSPPEEEPNGFEVVPEKREIK